MIKTKKQMYLVIGAFALVMLLGGVTYAFFNYTRTGTANTIRTGKISFNTSQSNTLNLTNVFPMSATDAGNANLDDVSVRIWGDTTYVDGEEFEISIVDVNNTIGSGASAKTIPINYIASYTVTPVQSGDPNVIGTNSDSYFTARGQSSLVYQLKTTGEATNGEQVLIGFIPSGATGVDGTLTIKAYLDIDNVVISDTYPSGTVRNVITTDYSSSDCEAALTGVTNASTYCATASSLQDAIDNENLTGAQIILLVNAGIVEEYTNGTPSSFGENKTVLTTAEWNALQNTQTPLSFKIKAVSQEGTWVEEPITAPTIASCPGCKFMFPTSEITRYYYSSSNYNSQPVSTTTTFTENGDVLVDDYTTLNKSHFLGFKFDESGNITKAYTCGIKGESPNQGTAFCLEASMLAFTTNASLVTGPTLWNDPDYTQGRCSNDNSDCSCEGIISVSMSDDSDTVVTSAISTEYSLCLAEHGEIWCGEPG